MALLEANYYPFSNFKIKSEQTISRALTRQEMARIASLKLPLNSSAWHQQNLFLLSYCFIGINLADLLTLTKENFIDGRIVFRRKKTHKVYSILIQDKAKEILDYYPSVCSKDFILPFIVQKNSPIQLKKDIQQAIKTCNKYLLRIAVECKIEKPVSTYYSRYSWANIAKGLGYTKDLIAEALGHEYGNKVTGIYLDSYDNETLDSMNEKVVEAVFKY